MDEATDAGAGGEGGDGPASGVPANGVNGMPSVTRGDKGREEGGGGGDMEAESNVVAART